MAHVICVQPWISAPVKSQKDRKVEGRPANLAIGLQVHNLLGTSFVMQIFRIHKHGIPILLLAVVGESADDDDNNNNDNG